MELADAVVTLGTTMKAEITSRGVSAEKVTVVPNAVESDWFTPVRRDPDLRVRLGLPGDAVVIGYVSSLRRLEGIDLLIETIAQLVHEGREIAGLIVGDGPELSRLRSRADELGVGDRISIPGPVDHSEVDQF